MGLDTKLGQWDFIEMGMDEMRWDEIGERGIGLEKNGIWIKRDWIQ